jgi:hypothetical protein
MDETLAAPRELYCAFGSDADPRTAEWWDAQTERAAERGWSSADVRREALARAREVLEAHSL